MNKLIKKVDKQEENSQPENFQSTSLTFTKKVETKTDEYITDTPKLTKIEEAIISKPIKKISVSTPDDIADWLLNFVGSEVIETLKKNPFLQLPYTEESMPPREWLVKALKTIFKVDELQQIGNKITLTQNQTSDLQSISSKAVEAKDTEISSLTKKLEELAEDLDNLENARAKTQKQMKTAVDLKKFIALYFEDPANNSEELKRVINLLNEALENPDDKTSPFIVNFAKGYSYFKAIYDNLAGDEKEQMEKLHGSITVLLKNISNLHISERRPLLDLIAKIASKKFENYEFVSPEQTLQIDPALHNAQGLGNSLIKEGKTFAVVRKTTKKAVVYADVEVVK